MPHRVLFDDGTHRNILLEDFGLTGLAVQANQHLIVQGGEAMILDPGGHKVYSHALAATMSLLGRYQPILGVESGSARNRRVTMLVLGLDGCPTPDETPTPDKESAGTP